jgi:hypothetical protein
LSDSDRVADFVLNRLILIAHYAGYSLLVVDISTIWATAQGNDPTRTRTTLAVATIGNVVVQLFACIHVAPAVMTAINGGQPVGPFGGGTTGASSGLGATNNALWALEEVSLALSFMALSLSFCAYAIAFKRVLSSDRARYGPNGSGAADGGRAGGSTTPVHLRSPPPEGAGTPHGQGRGVGSSDAAIATPPPAHFLSADSPDGSPRGVKGMRGPHSVGGGPLALPRPVLRAATAPAPAALADASAVAVLSDSKSDAISPLLGQSRSTDAEAKDAAVAAAPVPEPRSPPIAPPASQSTRSATAAVDRVLIAAVVCAIGFAVRCTATVLALLHTAAGLTDFDLLQSPASIVLCYSGPELIPSLLVLALLRTARPAPKPPMFVRGPDGLLGPAPVPAALPISDRDDDFAGRHAAAQQPHAQPQAAVQYYGRYDIAPVAYERGGLRAAVGAYEADPDPLPSDSFIDSEATVTASTAAPVDDGHAADAYGGAGHRGIAPVRGTGHQPLPRRTDNAAAAAAYYRPPP